MRPLIDLRVFYASLLVLQSSVLAKPFHRSHESAHQIGDLHQKHHLQHDRASIPEVLEAFRPKIAVRDTVNAILTREGDLVTRDENGSSDVDNTWGRWRSFGPYTGGTGSFDPNSGSKTQLAQLLQALDSSFHALSAYLAKAYQFESSQPSSTTRTSLASQPTAESSTKPTSVAPTTRPASSATVTSVSPNSALTTSPSASTPSSTTSAYTFNPLRKDLNAVYYAQSPATPQVPFSQVCNDPKIDVIILAFVSHFFVDPARQPSRYPTINLASKCWAPNAAQVAAGATTLQDCVSPGFAAEVKACQASGKKVMLSLGGAVGYSNTDIPNEAKARELAQTLWDLFLGGTNPDVANIRTFGDVVLDGIDIDNENPTGPTYLPVLASTLRSLFQNATANDPSKTYYLSAARQCPRPDANIPIASMLNNLDFVMPQFYNNPQCNLNSGQAFLDSLSAWSSDIASTSAGPSVDIGNGLTTPRLLIGTPANLAAGSGYVDPNTYEGILDSVKGLGLANLAGAMYWDGAYVELAKQNNGGTGFGEVVREVLGS